MGRHETPEGGIDRQTKSERVEKRDAVGVPQPTSYEKSPSTLYQVYQHAPQLLVKARGPKGDESSAASLSAGSDPTDLPHTHCTVCDHRFQAQASTLSKNVLYEG